jgi:hypothetical protein
MKFRTTSAHTGIRGTDDVEGSTEGRLLRVLEEELAGDAKDFGIILNRRRLDQVGIGAQIVGVSDILLQIRRADHHREKPFRNTMLPEPFEKLKAVQPRHLEIDKHRVRFREKQKEHCNHPEIPNHPDSALLPENLVPLLENPAIVAPMLTDNLDWIKHAQDADSFHVDIGWIIHPEFYYGPDHPKTPEEWEQFKTCTLKLSLPPIAKGSYILSSDAISSPGQLLDHYFRILSLCREYGKSVESQSFWMRPVIWSGDGRGISFSWMDTYAETLYWVDAICRNDDGELFHDIDQGWQVAFLGRGEFIFGAGSSDDDDEDPANIDAFRFTRAPLQAKVRAASDRAAILVNKIKNPARH